MDRLAVLLATTLESHLAGRSKPVPEAGALAWRWFADLCRTRTYHMAGPNPISYAEIEAYARLYRWPLEARHVDLILAMDRVWLEHAAKDRMEREDGKTFDGRRASQVPTLTAACFDVVFG